MADTRSPRYPNISLGDAISKARAIYSKEHMSAMTPQVAAEAMGYAGINGSSLKTISSLRKYGLLEGRGDDVRLSRDAQILVIDDPKSVDYNAAIAKCAMAPEVYAEINKQFPGVASERNISVYLEKQGFKPDAAASVAKNYKDSMTLVSAQVPPYNEAELAPTAMSGGIVIPSQSISEVSRASGAVSAETHAVGSAGVPYRVVQDGNRLHITASVDLPGLRKLKKIIENYESLLEILEGDEGGGTKAQ